MNQPGRTTDIVLFLQGGLGNQVCQIVFCKRLAVELNANLHISTSLYSSKFRALRGVTSRSVSPAIEGFIKTHISTLSVFNYYWLRFLARLPLNAKQLFVINDSFWDNNISIQALRQKSLIIVKSHCASSQLYKPLYDDQWIELYNSISSFSLSSGTPAVIHIRRGDYLKWPNLYYCQSSDYYIRGADQFVSLGVDKILILTDSPEWVASIDWPSHLRSCVNISSLGSDITDFLLICRSRYICTSNSTFSCTAAHIASLISQPILVTTPFNWFPPSHPGFFEIPGCSFGDMRKDNWKIL